MRILIPTRTGKDVFAEVSQEDFDYLQENKLVVKSDEDKPDDHLGVLYETSTLICYDEKEQCWID